MNRNIIVTLVGIITGLATGWLYWKYFGCQGNCAITSKPLNSSIYGGILGGLLFNAVCHLNKTKKHHDKFSQKSIESWCRIKCRRITSERSYNHRCPN